MMQLGSTSFVTDGVQVFHDHADGNVFWYLPGPVSMGTRPDGSPAFTLMVFKPAPGSAIEKGGGFLTFESMLTLDTSRKNKILGQCRARAADPQRDVELSPVPFDGGSVECIALNVQGPGGTAANPAPPGSFNAVEKILGTNVPALFGDNRAAFSLMLDQEGATIVRQSLAKGGAPVGVIYKLQFTALRPALHVKITCNLKRVYEEFGASLNAQIYMVRGGIEAVLQNLQQQGVLKIEITSFTPDSAEQEKWAMQFFVDHLLKEWFEPTLGVADIPKAPTLDPLNPGGAAKPAATGGVTGAGATVGSGSHGGTGSAAGTAGQALPGKVTPGQPAPGQPKAGGAVVPGAAVKPAQPGQPAAPAASAKPAMPGAATPAAGAPVASGVPGFPGAAAPAAVPGAAVPGAAVPGAAVPGAAVPGVAVPGVAVPGAGTPVAGAPAAAGSAAKPAAAPKPAGVSPAAAAGGGGIKVPVQPGAAGGAIDTAAVSFKLKFVHQEELRQLEFVYDRTDAVQRTYAPQGFFGDLGNALLDPAHLIEIDLDDAFFRTLQLEGESMVSDFSTIGLQSMHLALSYGRDTDEGGPKTTDFMFTPGSPATVAWDPPLNATLDSEYRYRLEYHFDPDSGWHGADVAYTFEGTSEDRRFELSPYHQLGFVDVVVQPGDFDPQIVRGTDVQLTYDDGSGWARTDIVHVEPGAAPQNWRVRTANQALASYHCEFRHTLVDGSVRTDVPEPQPRSASTIVVNDPFSDHLEIDLVPAWQGAVRTVLVDLDYDDGAGCQSHRRVELDGAAQATQHIRIGIVDPAVRSFTWKATFVGVDGVTTDRAATVTPDTVVRLSPI